MIMRKLIDVEVEMILNHGAAITDRQTDNISCQVAIATENASINSEIYSSLQR